ncbi:bifunctional proline dehydrogenase/L-glutamate gamma-semialdehyde dehydrogenase PutA [Yunchengibacter salinarum]|uniref:bifunctional proline dehydrogenase/L-glutamate gamma-semialdehyde dehydrogenase PutA n=1 Tax=Yunchengibacter salinarum TaxID=3133399 RepID=UPI0035B60F2D
MDDQIAQKMTHSAEASGLGAVRARFHADEAEVVGDLRAAYPLDGPGRAAVSAAASAIVAQSRAMREDQGSLDAFLAEFGLSNQEGVALMCLAEALLRVPDDRTRDQLIAEKIRSGDWSSHLGHSDRVFVNASTWALMLTGRVVSLDDGITKSPGAWIKRMVSRTGEPVIRGAVGQAMKIMGRQFVFGRSIAEALSRQAKQPEERRRMSFDMLGEGARTMAAAERYFEMYADALEQVGQATGVDGASPHERSSLSIKLSALHPRYDSLHEDRVRAEMLPRVKTLAKRARHYDIQMTIDAEEADRLDLSLRLFRALAEDPELAGWEGLGLAVQAYQKRAPEVVDWLADLARATGRRFPVRLVKGAYWDTEIKHAQIGGEADYAVFTRKPNTDLCYLVTASRMLDAGAAFYPQFATHNAHTIAAIAHMAGDRPFEFQKLHGMGDLLYEAAGRALGQTITTRTYAPVGAHADLLPYLVRRLLENGANSSFVNRFMDADVPVEEIATDPYETTGGDRVRHSAIPLPGDLYGARRRNSKGINLYDETQRDAFLAAIERASTREVNATCLIGGKPGGGAAEPVMSPSDGRERVGSAAFAEPDDLERAVQAAEAAFPAWDSRGGAARAAILRRMADALEAHMARLSDVLIREAGKTLDDCVAEVREAVDFLRYYAVQAEDGFETPIELPGPTGESNRMMLTGRGVFLTIAPWNFPLAIFTGQLAAALAAGNTVIAKPAEQTCLVAHEAVRLFHEAGVPEDVLHLILGPGADVAAPLVADARISGVAFTGSTRTARAINRTLAARDGAIVPLIAETGGQNAMVVDSTALHEQVVDDVLLSAFGSAGQRCSALRVLYVQRDVADRFQDMLVGALKERRVGYPGNPATDVGPIIDRQALSRLEAHVSRMEREARLVARADLTDGTQYGTYLAPHIFEIDGIHQLDGEVFGPVLHIVRFDASELDKVIAAINSTGFGLTFGVHSRLENRWATLFDGVKAGNSYINRNMTGAVVGVQPFGGQGLSGTGPKAGGPHYLYRFANERVLTVNTAAIGGNTALFSLSDG